MKKIYILLIFVINIYYYSYSQSDVPNSSFENWRAEFNDKQEFLYEEPDDEWWGTLNKLRRLGPSAPVTTTKTTDAHSGMYAAKLETLPFGNDFVIPGMLLTGVFKPELYGYLEGRSFSGKPSRLKGFYKFKQVEGDSCSIYVNLTKYNYQKGQKDTIAEGSLMIKEPTDEYKEFIVNFNYYTSDLQPDTIKIVFISSAGVRGIGSTVNAKIGNTMLIDDLILEYPNGIEIPLMSENLVKIFFDNRDEKLKVILDNQISGAKIKIFSISGNEIICYTLDNQLEYHFDFYFPKGYYFYSIIHDEYAIYNGNFIK